MSSRSPQSNIEHELDEPFGRWPRLLILTAIGMSLLLLLRFTPVDAQSGGAANRPRSPLSPLSPLTTTVGITAVQGITDPAVAGALVTTPATVTNQAAVSTTTNLTVPSAVLSSASATGVITANVAATVTGAVTAVPSANNATTSPLATMTATITGSSVITTSPMTTTLPLTTGLPTTLPLNDATTSPLVTVTTPITGGIAPLPSEAIASPLPPITTGSTIPADAPPAVVEPVTETTDLAVTAGAFLATLSRTVNRGQTSLVLVAGVFLGLFIVIGLLLRRQR